MGAYILIRPWRCPQVPLSDTTVRMAKPRPRRTNLANWRALSGDPPSGSRYWRLKYRFAGKEKRLAFGVYPVVTLAKARAEALEARRLLHDGIDPAIRKKERERDVKLAAANSFESVARTGTRSCGRSGPSAILRT